MGVADRFWAKVDKTEGCWLWTASALASGYGKFYLKGRTVLAHRVAYELAVGAIPDGLTIDHLCRNPSCVNPSHLEPVTMRVNVLRGEGCTARQARQTHCVHGHLFDDINTYIKPNGKRACRACHTYRERKRRERLAA